MSVIDIAKAQLGYTELPVNNTHFGKWYGLNNQPWCAIFVSWVFNEAGLANKIAAQNKKGFASCSAGLAWFAKQNKLVPVGEAQEGDIVFFQFDADKEPDHVGIVQSHKKKLRTLYVWEGNTSSNKTGSQSNGDGFYLKKRSYGIVMAIARPKGK